MNLVTWVAFLRKLITMMSIHKSLLQTIFLNVWRMATKWSIMESEQGVYSFFLDSKEDCKTILGKRPWIINNSLLNIIEWPEAGFWYNSNFDSTVFTIQAHGLPIQYVSDKNAERIAMKASVSLSSDGKSKLEIINRGFICFKVLIMINHHLPGGFFLNIPKREPIWIQFKYPKLPFICFNCGRLDHDQKKCPIATAIVYPLVGNAIKMYGHWIKIEGKNSSCFDAKANHMEKETEKTQKKLEHISIFAHK